MANRVAQPFRFRQFEIEQSHSAMRVGTDAVLLGSWANMQSARHILDVGTGTGVIALICAQRNPSAMIEAVEVDEGSAADARYNFSQSPWSNRLKIYQQDFLKLTLPQTYDCIISNPPYFSHSLRAARPERNTARHDDSLPAKSFLQQAARLLKKNGMIALIIPRHQLRRWLEQGAEQAFFPQRICHVFTRPYKESSRVMLEFSKEQYGDLLMESLLIEKKQGEFSEAYQAMTHDFYTKW